MPETELKVKLQLPEVNPALVDAGILHLDVGDDELSGICRVPEVAPGAKVPVLGPVLHRGVPDERLNILDKGGPGSAGQEVKPCSPAHSGRTVSGKAWV